MTNQDYIAIYDALKTEIADYKERLSRTERSEVETCSYFKGVIKGLERAHVLVIRQANNIAPGSLY